VNLRIFVLTDLKLRIWSLGICVYGFARGSKEFTFRQKKPVLSIRIFTILAKNTAVATFLRKNLRKIFLAIVRIIRKTFGFT